MWRQLQARLGKNKEVKTSIEWESIGWISHVFNSIGNSKDKNIDQILGKSMKECLCRHFSRNEKKEKERQRFN